MRTFIGITALDIENKSKKIYKCLKARIFT